MKHLVVVAGEESGDMHAATFIRELKQHSPDLIVSGIGGQHMEDAGAVLVSDLARHAVTGFIEVISHLGMLRKGFKTIKAHLTQTKPDLLVLVDFPGFNLRLLKYAKHKLNLRILYYISPQIWAWKPKRIHLIKQCVDHMAVIFPFEKKLYDDAKVSASFVGHPLVDKIPTSYDMSALRASFDLPSQKRIIALLPGSRRNEIRFLMPPICDAANRLHQQYPNLHFVIPLASSISESNILPYLSKTHFSYSFTKSRTIDTVCCSDAVIVASGTASLECALLTKPMCIIYRASWLTYLIATRVMRVRFLGLCNLLQNKMIVPELLQDDCNGYEIAKTISIFLSSQEEASYMVQRLTIMRDDLSKNKADMPIAQLIEKEIERQ